MLDSVKKGIDFVKKNFDSVVHVPLEVPPGHVLYSFRECPEDISDFPAPFPEDECIYPLKGGVSVGGYVLVGDVVDSFPIEMPDRLVFRFKVEDDVFGHVWLDNLGRDSVAPTFKGNVQVQVLRCHSAVSACGAVQAEVTKEVRVAPNREELVRARMEREAAQIQAARDFAQAKALEEANKRQGKLDVQAQIGSELDKWAMTEQGKYKDVRSLLSSISNVLWPNSGWVEIPMGELMMNEAMVKKTYRKAIIMCHPDRHQHANVEQQYRADRIFNAINESFKVFSNSS
jgi:hypothetical protein